MLTDIDISIRNIPKSYHNPDAMCVLAANAKLSNTLQLCFRNSSYYFSHNFRFYDCIVKIQNISYYQQYKILKLLIDKASGSSRATPLWRTNDDHQIIIVSINLIFISIITQSSSSALPQSSFNITGLNDELQL